MSEALKNNLSALELYKGMGDKQGMAECEWNIGEIYFYQGNYSAALEKYRFALPFYKESRDYLMLAWIYQRYWQCI